MGVAVVGLVDGVRLGLLDTNTVGVDDGIAVVGVAVVGLCDGLNVGFVDGLLVGLNVGLNEGFVLGFKVGCSEGFTLGSGVGGVGDTLGYSVKICDVMIMFRNVPLPRL